MGRPKIGRKKTIPLKYASMIDNYIQMRKGEVKLVDIKNYVSSVHPKMKDVCLETYRQFIRTELNYKRKKKTKIYSGRYNEVNLKRLFAYSSKLLIA